MTPPALRDAAWAMSHVLATIGDQAGAVREAQALVSLCRTSPPAPEAGLLAALDRVADLTGAPRIAAAPRKERKRKERKERPERPERPERSAGDRRAPPAPELDPVVAAADAGQFEDAFAALRGRRGPRAQLRRVYARLSAALAEPDVAARDAALDALRDNIRRLLVGEPPDAAAPQRAEAPPPTGDDPLSKLLGRPAPRRRKALIELIEAYADENPGQLDELAATALRHHVEGEGLRAPAPWLVGLVGRALATGDAPLERRRVRRHRLRRAPVRRRGPARQRRTGRRLGRDLTAPRRARQDRAG
jgi:hypothetical protein